jgi:hypothetical protein
MGSPWTDLSAVIAAAAPGDTVLLNGMTFPPFSMQKGLTIVGPGVVAGVLGSLQTTLTIPPGERAQVVDVDFQPFVHPSLGLFGSNKVVADGRVTFEGCTFGQGVPNNLVTSGSVMLLRCSVVGNSAAFWPQVVGGMAVQSGYCALVDCTIRGGNAVFCPSCASYWVPATPALRVLGGTVVASNSNFVGGSGFTSIFVPSSGIAAVQTAGVSYFTDCTLAAGANPAGSPLPALIGNATTFYARTLFGTAPGPQSNLAQLVGLQMPQPLRIGQQATITAVAGTGNLLGILAGFDSVVGAHPVVVEPVLTPLAQLVTLTTAIPTSGSAVSHVLAVPNAPTLVGLGVFVQAFQLDGLAVRASAAVGSVVH